MAQVQRSVRLYRKAEAALIAAIEVYNKPDFKYREETFAILALNAWEPLLKARVLKAHKNDMRSLYVYDTRPTKRGSSSKKTYVRRNRTGNPQTLSLGQAIVALESDSNTRLASEIKTNLDALVEIRDNAVHFINASPLLAKQVLEVGTACLKNFVELSKRWFNEDLSGYSLFLMPIGFVSSRSGTALLNLPDEEGKLMTYLAGLVKDAGESSADFHVSLEIDLSFKRATSAGAALVALTKEPGATKVMLSEEDVLKAYPWSYADLTKRLRERFTDFKQTSKYHAVRKPLESDLRYAKQRYLVPGNTRSPKVIFFNPNIVQEFDKVYTLKVS